MAERELMSLSDITELNRKGYHHYHGTGWGALTDLEINALVETARAAHEWKKDYESAQRGFEAQLARSFELVAENEKLREQAAIATAFMKKLPRGYSWNECPSEYVTYLQDEVFDIREQLNMVNTSANMSAEVVKCLEMLRTSGEPVAWANWKVGTKSYVPFRSRDEAMDSVRRSEIAATQEGPYEVVDLYAALPPPKLPSVHDIFLVIDKELIDEPGQEDVMRIANIILDLLKGK